LLISSARVWLGLREQAVGAVNGRFLGGDETKKNARTVDTCRTVGCSREREKELANGGQKRQGLGEGSRTGEFGDDGFAYGLVCASDDTDEAVLDAKVSVVQMPGSKHEHR